MCAEYRHSICARGTRAATGGGHWRHETPGATSPSRQPFVICPLTQRRPAITVGYVRGGRTPDRPAFASPSEAQDSDAGDKPSPSLSRLALPPGSIALGAVSNTSRRPLCRGESFQVCRSSGQSSSGKHKSRRAQTPPPMTGLGGGTMHSGPPNSDTSGP